MCFARVGGRWLDGAECGLWALTVNETSSNANTGYGARPLILGFGVFRTDSLLVS